jgi:hypothetical protein
MGTGLSERYHHLPDLSCSGLQHQAIHSNSQTSPPAMQGQSALHEVLQAPTVLQYQQPWQGGGAIACGFKLC